METPKRFTLGTHRAIPPSEMLGRVQPLLARAGITRIADITGLDRIGIPVLQAIRPSARSLSVASGKGLTGEAARVSAIMEAVEIFHAEDARIESISLPYTELVTRCSAVEPGELALLPGAAFAPKLTRSWCFGRDLYDETQVAVPTECVTLSEPRATLSPFQVSSNGLASGAVYVEALASALLELVERDAVACWQAAWLRGTPLPRVRLETAVDMPLVGEILVRLARAKVHPVVFDCTVDTRIPVYSALLWDGVQRHFGLYRGSGAHLDPEVALIRALTEAVQSRAVYLAGSRDDMFVRDFLAHKAQDDSRTVDALEAQPATVDLRDRRSSATSTFESDIRLIADALLAVGVERLVVVDLTQAAFRDALAVVRVIATGLAVPSTTHRHVSARAGRFALQVAA